MKKSPFDKNLKDNLQQYISKVDTNELWANIESEVDIVNKNKRMKNRFFIWLLCSGIILLGGSFYLTKIFSTTTPIVEKSQILSTPIIASSSSIIEKEKDNSLLDDPTTSNTVIKKVNKTAQKNSFQNTSKKSDSPKNNLFTNQQIEYFSPLENQEVNNNIIQGSSNQKKKKEKFVSSTPIDKTPILASSFALLKNDSTFSNQLLDEDWKFAASDLNRNSINNSKEPFQFSFEIKGGASKTSRGLLRNQSEPIDYINLRKETEKVLETVHLAALVSLAHRSGFEISSGIQWTSITEKFEFEGSRIVSDTMENGLYGFIINPNGDTIPVYDQVINQSEIFYNKKTYNKYRMIGIPVLLGYHWKNGNWTLGFEGGVIANISLKTSGNIFNPQEEIIDIEKEQNKVFRSKIGLNYYLGLNGRYNITEHLQITINPSFRFFPKSFTIANYALNQKYYIMGGNLGLRYSF